VGLLDVETGACHRLASHTSNTILTAVKVVQFSSSGRFLASASFTNIVKLWDLKKGNKYYSLTGFHDSSVTDLAFSPNEQYLASAGSRDEKLALWNVAQSTLHANLSGHTSTISSVEFLDDGMTLISACYDDTVRLWDVRTGQQKISIAGRHLSEVTICTRRHLLASAFQVEGADYAMYLRRLPTGSLLAAFRGFDTEQIFLNIGYGMNMVVKRSVKILQWEIVTSLTTWHQLWHGPLFEWSKCIFSTF
jgi:WD40 repeat protein